MSKQDTAYFVFDIESVADGGLVSKLKYPGENLAPAAAIAKFRAELLAENGKDFIPYTYQLPISLVIAKLSRDSFSSSATRSRSWKSRESLAITSDIGSW